MTKLDVVDYLNSMVNLYGFIRADDAFSLISNFEKSAKKVDFEAFLHEIHDDLDNPFIDYIVYFEMRPMTANPNTYIIYNSGLDEGSEWKTIAQKHFFFEPYICQSKEELLNFKDPLYRAPSPFDNVIISFLLKIKNNNDKDIARALLLAIKVQAIKQDDINHIIALLSLLYNVEFSSLELFKLTCLISLAAMYERSWHLNGNRIVEILHIKQDDSEFSSNIAGNITDLLSRILIIDESFDFIKEFKEYVLDEEKYNDEIVYSFIKEVVNRVIEKYKNIENKDNIKDINYC